MPIDAELLKRHFSRKDPAAAEPVLCPPDAYHAKPTRRRYEQLRDPMVWLVLAFLVLVFCTVLHTMAFERWLP